MKHAKGTCKILRGMPETAPHTPNVHVDCPVWWRSADQKHAIRPAAVAIVAEALRTCCAAARRNVQ